MYTGWELVLADRREPRAATDRGVEDDHVNYISDSIPGWGLIDRGDNSIAKTNSSLHINQTRKANLTKSERKYKSIIGVSTHF